MVSRQSLPHLLAPDSLSFMSSKSQNFTVLSAPPVTIPLWTHTDTHFSIFAKIINRYIISLDGPRIYWWRIKEGQRKKQLGVGILPAWFGCTVGLSPFIQVKANMLMLQYTTTFWKTVATIWWKIHEGVSPNWVHGVELLIFEYSNEVIKAIWQLHELKVLSLVPDRERGRWTTELPHELL